MSDSKPVLFTEHVAHTFVITLNRPARHHAIDFALGTAIAEAVEDAEANDAVRVIVINGSGDKAFCAGQDMLEMSGIEPSEQKPKSSSAAIAIDRVATATKPVVAAINGVCYGGGALLALACDIRVSSDTASFRFPGAEYGLVVGAAWLPRLVGTSKAKELIYTARKFDANEALDCGLLSHVYTGDVLMQKALSLAGQIAKNSVIAIRESKRVIDAATLVQDAETLERDINQNLRGSKEQTERFNSATTKVTGKPT